MAIKTKLAQTSLIVTIAGLSGAAQATLNPTISISPIQANYSISQPSMQPNLLSGAVKTYTHKLVVVDVDPNNVVAQRRIRQGWYKDAAQTRYCIHPNGSMDSSCAWHDWQIDWQYQSTSGSFNQVDTYKSTISLAGDAYANWPLFPADEAAYQENPNWIIYPPKTRYWIETRFYHPTAGWLYSMDTFDLYCNGEPAWQHWSGQTSCPGL